LNLNFGTKGAFAKDQPKIPIFSFGDIFRGWNEIFQQAFADSLSQSMSPTKNLSSRLQNEMGYFCTYNPSISFAYMLYPTTAASGLKRSKKVAKFIDRTSLTDMGFNPFPHLGGIFFGETMKFWLRAGPSTHHVQAAQLPC
jgi:hypothetical protein